MAKVGYSCHYCKAQGEDKFFLQEDAFQDHVFGCHYSSESESESESDSDFKVSSPKKVCKANKLSDDKLRMEERESEEEAARGRSKSKKKKSKIESNSSNTSKAKMSSKLVKKRGNAKQVNVKIHHIVGFSFTLGFVMEVIS